MSLLAIDVENRAIALGLFEGDVLAQHWVVGAGTRTADEFSWLLEPALAAGSVERAVLSSVVPSITQSLRTAVARRVPDVLTVGPGVKTGLALAVDNPREVGTDRVVGAVAAVALFGAPIVVVDFRTATTIDVVDSEGVFRGGAIAAGLEVSMTGLAASAAALRHVEIVRPTHVVARNTVEAIQSGVVLGAAAMVEGLIARMEMEEDLPGVRVVATGIHAREVAAVCSRIDAVEDHLTLQGLRVIAARNPI